MTPPPTLHASRVLRRDRHGSSSPVVVETTNGQWYTKLRGAAQGITPLIAELIVASLAEQLKLPVPERALIVLATDIPSDDVNDELRDLLDASAGTNVGLALLEAARNLTASEYERVPLDIAAGVLWLDMLVQNLDRSAANPNIMVRRGTYWLIDHGAALPFQHDWPNVSEASASRPYNVSGHLFGWAAPILGTVHEQSAPRITRDALIAAVSCVPDEFLAAFGGDTERRRAMYVALLWKRLRWMSEQFSSDAVTL